MRLRAGRHVRRGGRGRLLDDRLRRLATRGDERRRRAGPVTLERIMPSDMARERVEAIDVSVRGGDQPVAIQEQRDVARLHLVVRPHDLAAVAVERYGVTVEADED